MELWMTLNSYLYLLIAGIYRHAPLYSVPNTVCARQTWVPTEPQPQPPRQRRRKHLHHTHPRHTATWRPSWKWLKTKLPHKKHKNQKTCNSFYSLVRNYESSPPGGCPCPWTAFLGPPTLITWHPNTSVCPHIQEGHSQVHPCLLHPVNALSPGPAKYSGFTKSVIIHMLLYLLCHTHASRKQQLSHFIQCQSCWKVRVPRLEMQISGTTFA